ncbi:MAG: hypothetical protein FIA97_10065 [Methylococcaceae bacterium]|nr:hypothetical protein [Methylococcaceae bacterium]
MYRSPPTSLVVTLLRLVGSIVLTALLLSCGPPRQPKVMPVPVPTARNAGVNVQGALVNASPYDDPAQAETAFGFDVRGAGLYPVRFALDNRSRAVVHIRPEQTFLIDREGQAWPVLTSDQAYNRVSNAVSRGDIARTTVDTVKLFSAAGAATGFALGTLLGKGFIDPVLQGVGIGAGFGVMDGLSDSGYAVETAIRKDLASKTLKNQRVQPGDLVYGVLFFPGRDEAKSARSLRLCLELDGYPEIVNVPLQ